MEHGTRAAGMHNQEQRESLIRRQLQAKALLRTEAPSFRESK